MIKTCRFCKAPFTTTDIPVENSCSDCKQEIKNIIKRDSDYIKELLTKDGNIRFKFLEVVLDDEKVITRIAKAFLHLPASEIGLGGPGTIADFFPDSLPAKITEGNS